MNKEKFLVVVGGVTLIFLVVTNISPILLYLSPVAVQGQSEKPLPVLLIHGYRSTNEVWNEWVDRLENLGIETEAVSFEDDPATDINEDECGSAEDHATQLNQKITDFKAETGREKINVVTHSKGGLDARLYLANSPSSADVANLIMIGTPNEGSPLADRYHLSDDCKPAVDDLRTTSPVLTAEKNEHTTYHTIASNWISMYEFNLPFQWTPDDIPWMVDDINCPFPSSWFDLEGWNLLTFQYNGRIQLLEPNDGIVPVESVEEIGEFNSLGGTDNCHTNMFTDEEFQKVLEVLLG